MRRALPISTFRSPATRRRRAPPSSPWKRPPARNRPSPPIALRWSPPSASWWGEEIPAAFPSPDHTDLIAAAWAAGLDPLDAIRRLGVVRFSVVDAMPSARLGLARDAGDALAAVRPLLDRPYTRRYLARIAQAGALLADRNLQTIGKMLSARVVTVEQGRDRLARVVLTGLGLALAREAGMPLHGSYGGGYDSGDA